MADYEKNEEKVTEEATETEVTEAKNDSSDKKVTESKKVVKNKKPGLFSKLGKLFKDTKGELKHVTWANKHSTTMNTILVIAVLVIVGVVLTLLDTGFERLFTWLYGLY